jgi:hypothetical protein
MAFQNNNNIYVKDGTSSVKSTKTKSGATTSGNSASNINTSEDVYYNEYTDSQLELIDYNVYINNIQSNDRFATSIKANSLNGVEGIPYQFLPNVDRRIDNSGDGAAVAASNSEDISLIGRKYMEKIIVHMPLLFLAPCDPAFLDDKAITKEDVSLFTQAMLQPIEGLEELITSQSGRFYSADYNYGQYYNYLNAMLTSVATYLGIAKEKITIRGE